MSTDPCPYLPLPGKTWVTLCAWACCVASAHAHPISISSADVTVYRDRTVVRVRVSAEDFLWFYNLRPGPDDTIAAATLNATLARHGTTLADEFIIRDAGGLRLPGMTIGVEPASIGDDPLSVRAMTNTWLTYELAFATPTPPSHLTLQQRFGQSTRYVPSNMQVAVRQDGGPTFTPVRLTNRGNTETFGFDWDDPSASIGPDRFRDITARLTAGPGHVDLDLIVPLPILETWVPIARAERDFVTLSEYDATRPAIQDLLTARNGIAINGEPSAPRVVHLVLSPVNHGATSVRAAAERISAWSGRVRARLRYAASANVQKIDINWKLFNGVVLSQRLVLETNGSKLQHTVSTYAPRHTWNLAPASTPNH